MKCGMRINLGRALHSLMEWRFSQRWGMWGVLWGVFEAVWGVQSWGPRSRAVPKERHRTPILRESGQPQPSVAAGISPPSQHSDFLQSSAKDIWPSEILRPPPKKKIKKNP